MNDIKMINRYGYDEFFEKQMNELNFKETELIPARVIEVQKEQYKIVTNEGEKRARLKGSAFYDNSEAVYPAVGDFVAVKTNPLGDDVIFKVLQRKTKFSRLDSFNEIEQIVAANFEYVFIMTSLNKDFNIKRVERYLASAWQSGASPVIVLTKSDLCENIEEYVNEIEEIAPFVPIIPISSMTGDGLEKLAEYVKPSKAVVFLGSSGVGKSSLVNALSGHIAAKVSGIREDDSKGRHTTTYRHLFMLENGAIVIDTPGMRELGMWNVSEGLSTTFSDIEELMEECRFGNCNHKSEPGCAIKEALENGKLSLQRWENYKKLQKEVAFAESKEKLSVRMKEKAKQKNLSKYQKEYKKNKQF